MMLQSQKLIKTSFTMMSFEVAKRRSIAFHFPSAAGEAVDLDAGESSGTRWRR